MNADLIVVVEKGKIVEQGSHEHLLQRKGRYADLWSKQAFLKPQEYIEDENEEPDAVGIVNVVNDLSTDKATEEASKVKSASKDEGETQLEE